jgi:hypothetical protein
MRIHLARLPAQAAHVHANGTLVGPYAPRQQTHLPDGIIQRSRRKVLQDRVLAVDMRME